MNAWYGTQLGEFETMFDLEVWIRAGKLRDSGYVLRNGETYESVAHEQVKAEQPELYSADNTQESKEMNTEATKSVMQELDALRYEIDEDAARFSIRDMQDLLLGLIKKIEAATGVPFYPGYGRTTHPPSKADLLREYSKKPIRRHVQFDSWGEGMGDSMGDTFAGVVYELRNTTFPARVTIPVGTTKEEALAALDAIRKWIDSDDYEQDVARMVAQDDGRAEYHGNVPFNEYCAK